MLGSHVWLTQTPPEHVGGKGRGLGGTYQGVHHGLFPHLPSFSVQFPDETLRSGELLNMIVAVIDSAQVLQGLSSWEAWAWGGGVCTCAWFRPGG